MAQETTPVHAYLGQVVNIVSLVSISKVEHLTKRKETMARHPITYSYLWIMNRR